MNERVKKLTEQCYEKHELLGTYEFNKEKFAELIIKDCMGVVQNAVDHRDPASTYVDKIKQHFGVEVQS